jgi:streptogramin lyase
MTADLTARFNAGNVALAMSRRVVMVALLLSLWVAAPARAARLERFPLPGRQNPGGVVQGPDGAVWFTTDRGVGRVEPSGHMSLFRVRRVEVITLVPGPDGALYGTALKPDGTLGDRVVRVAMDGSTTMVAYSGPGHGVEEIAPGPAGDLWAAIEVPAAIVRMTPAGAVTARIRLPRGTEPTAMATAPDGTLGFLSADLSEGNRFGRVSPDGTLNLSNEPGFAEEQALVATPDGAFWATPTSGRRLLRWAPDGTIGRVFVGVPPSGITSASDGSLWFSYQGDRSGGVGHVGANGTGLELWPEPFGTAGPDPGAVGADGLAFDADGNLWATAFGEYSLERLPLASPPPVAGPLEPVLPRAGVLRRAFTLRASPDGSLWTIGQKGVVRIAPEGAQRLFGAGVAAHAVDVLPDPGGGAWIVFDGRGVARITADGKVRTYRRGFAKRAKIDALARGRDGALWLLDRADETVWRWTPGGHARHFRRGLGRRRDLLTIAPGPDNRMWITDQRGAILALSTNGRVRRYRRGLGRRSEPTAITAGPDGNLWFTMFFRRRVGRITPSGRVRLWRTRESPASITVGSDGALWFNTAAVSLDDTINGIGRIDVHGRLQEMFVRGSLSAGYRDVTSGADGAVYFLVDKGPTAVARIIPQRLAEIGVTAAR